MSIRKLERLKYMKDSLLINDLDQVIKLSDKEFFNNFAYIMQIALVKDDSLYVDLIDKMYEICERDKEVLSDVLERTNKAKTLIMTKDNMNTSSISALSFGYAFKEGLKELLNDKYLDGEYLSLGCVAQGYISYKKNWLTKEEYYELRDMFVPFYLPISVEMLDIDKALEKIISNLEKNKDGLYSMALLKKIGKTVVDNTVSIDDIKDAINELNFDEAW